jgi:hypothetical protein
VGNLATFKKYLYGNKFTKNIEMVSWHGNIMYTFRFLYVIKYRSESRVLNTSKARH